MAIMKVWLLICSMTENVQVSSFQLNAGTASQSTTTQLNVKDQSNKQDNWNNYIEYNRNFDGMLSIIEQNVTHLIVGTFTFELPGSIDPASVLTLSFVANIRLWSTPNVHLDWFVKDFGTLQV